MQDVVDVAWLSRVLRDGGVLVDGEVVSVAPRATSAFNSATVFADVVYRVRVLACRRGWW